MKGFRLIKKIAQNKQGRIGLIILLVLAVTAVFAPLIAPFDPYDVTMRDAKGLAPDKIHWLGTTITTGQDVFSMLIYGTRVSLGIGIITGIAISVLGSLLGRVSGTSRRYDYHADCRCDVSHTDTAADNSYH